MSIKLREVQYFNYIVAQPRIWCEVKLRWITAMDYCDGTAVDYIDGLGRYCMLWMERSKAHIVQKIFR